LGADGNDRADGDGIVLVRGTRHGMHNAAEVLVLHGAVFFPFEVLGDGNESRLWQLGHG
jgi:hypothetical protein